MSRQTCFPQLTLTAVVALCVSCGGKVPQVYETPPTLANRDEITDALRAVGSGLDARVILLVNVDDEGRVTDVRIKESSGDQGLDDAARWVGERMRFNPALHDGEPVAALVEVPVTFDVVEHAIRPARLRNADQIVSLILTDYPDLEGSCHMKVRVNLEGGISLVKDQRGTNRAVTRAGGKLAYELVFWPAYREFRPVETWVNVSIEFAGERSRVTAEQES